MLLLIEKAIDNACGNDGENILYPPHDYLAYSILNAIEERGMKPPAYWKNEGADSFPPVGLPCMIINWEPEELIKADLGENASRNYKDNLFKDKK